MTTLQVNTTSHSPVSATNRVKNGAGRGSSPGWGIYTATYFRSNDCHSRPKKGRDNREVSCRPTMPTLSGGTRNGPVTSLWAVTTGDVIVSGYHRWLRTVERLQRTDLCPMAPITPLYICPWQCSAEQTHLVQSAVSSYLPQFGFNTPSQFPSGTCLRPYHLEYTSSRLITEVKQGWAVLVLGWVTAWEYTVL